MFCFCFKLKLRDEKFTRRELALAVILNLRFSFELIFCYGLMYARIRNQVLYRINAHASSASIGLLVVSLF